MLVDVKISVAVVVSVVVAVALLLADGHGRFGLVRLVAAISVS